MARERLIRGVKFAVDRVDVPTRDGGSVRREVVVHPGAVVIVPVLDDGRIVMIRNWRFSIDRELWEFPAGTIEDGEDPLDCAARELLEETGYRAETLELLAAFYMSPGICTERMYSFVATGLTAEEQRLDATERIEVEPLSRERVDELLQTGKLEDAKSLASLLLWSRR